MKTLSPVEKYRPLLLATLAVIALPFALRMLGLSLNTGTTVVVLAIAAMGLNLCIGYTGWSRSVTAPGSASAPMRPG